MSNNRTNRFLPLWLAVSTILGILIGTFYGNQQAGNKLMNVIQGGSNKLSSLLYYLSDKYVDDVNVSSLVEKSIPHILSELDPHSTYVSASAAATADDDLRGSFSGVGIEFIIRQDTIRVQRVIPGGPAERAGLLAGDKIVTANNKVLTGDTITNQTAISTLKGPEGSKVTLGIMRHHEKTVKYFTVTREEIRMKSITATHMLDDNTGYIKLRNFGENTYPEMLVALARLSQAGFENLVVDLRGNTGGYVATAQQIVNEFLPSNRMIVYMEGKHYSREELKSNGHGSYQRIPLVVLIDEGSASASEIFAGAIQDNDRGTIVGRRSFGKGLVQEAIGFTDGSMMRLTIARYYTPSGRCIQKPYDEYEEDLTVRYERGELFTSDSIKHTGPAYHTRNGRTVYGGGGITPDVFVGQDTLGVTSYYKEAIISGLLMEFCFDYADRHEEELKKYDDEDDLVKYLKGLNLVEQFAQYGQEHSLPRRNLMIQKSHQLLEEFILARMVYNLLDEEALVKYQNRSDPAIKEALRLFKTKSAFPQNRER